MEATIPFLRRILEPRSLVAQRTPRRRSTAQDVLRLCHALLSRRGEVPGTQMAGDIVAAYRALDEAGRGEFFDLLSESFVPDPIKAADAAEAYRRAPSTASLLQLQAAVEPRRQELFRRLNLAPGATAALVELRQHLIATLRDHPERAGIDADLAHLFRAWFNGGFLMLRRIDWRTSAVVLERLIQYEAVHQIQGWQDLRRRLERDRRCYAFFHPALPGEPLIFIEVALTERISAAVEPLLDPGAHVVDPTRARCAMFYSITHCQEGLRGISFGGLLIKRVVEDLKRSLPRVRTFATLSPISGFRRWLESTDAMTGNPKLSELIMRGRAVVAIPPGAVSTDARRILMRLCAYYLLHIRQGDASYDTVARFHLANGARLERLNWLADPSASGMQRSYGLMANYLYRLDHLERNHESYARGDALAASRRVERLARLV